MTMGSRKWQVAYLVVFVALYTSLVADSSADEGQPFKLVEGTWTYRSPKTIVGEGADTTVELKQGRKGWEINYRIEHHPSVNEDKEIAITAEGPFPVTAKGGVMSIQRPDRKVTVTYKFSNRSLIMPAIIQPEPGPRFREKWSLAIASHRQTLASHGV